MRRIISKILEKSGLKTLAIKTYSKLEYFKLWWYITLSSKLTTYREENPKTYPIIIISYNQLKFFKKLIHFLKVSGYKNIIVLDNNSQYPPLLKYLDEIKKEVIVHRLNKNYGHMVFWKLNRFLKLYGRGYYAVTDADVVPKADCPKDFLEQFKIILDANPDYKKVGFNLNLNDIPLTNPHRDKIIKWENQFWEIKTKNGNFIADIDTTFALYKPIKKSGNSINFYKAIRLGPPYSAIHGGWHIDPTNLTEEQIFYMKNANESSSWRIDSAGNLVDPKYL